MQLFKLFILASALYAGVAAAPFPKDKDIMKREDVSNIGNVEADSLTNFVQLAELALKAAAEEEIDKKEEELVSGFCTAKASSIDGTLSREMSSVVFAPRKLTLLTEIDSDCK
ncbi:hypothetical protein DFH09DRAFT_1080154 [Mycena vulgaris]|nr:hypothetical protein DFH09DRAFT_1080154 [Mycena vulgaris]